MVRSRGVRLATAAAATITIAAGCTAPPAPQQSPPRTSIPKIEKSSTTTSSATTEVAATERDSDDAEEARSGRSELDRYRQQLADPASSDLTPDLFAELTDLGTRIEVAYLTGEGGENWPGYFGPDKVAAKWQEVQVIAAGARSRNGAPDAAEVTVIWSGQPVDGGATVDGHISVVLLMLRQGIWQPTAQFG
jgi:hypothetical protein